MPICRGVAILRSVSPCYGDTQDSTSSGIPMRRLGLLFVLLLSACATSDADKPIGEVVPPPGRYQNAQAWFQGELASAMREKRQSPKLTDKVAVDFADCVWSYLKLGFTPA